MLQFLINTIWQFKITQRIALSVINVNDNYYNYNYYNQFTNVGSVLLKPKESPRFMFNLFIVINYIVAQSDHQL
jgi:hypothetical protein